MSRLARTADRCAQVELIIAQTLEDLANRGGARVQIRRRLAAEAREHAEELHQWAVQLRATERLG